MKNKICYILLSLIVSFSFMNNVFAEEELSFSVLTSIDGEQTVTLGNEATINVSVKSDSYINTCTFDITSDDGLEKVSSNGANGFNISSSTDNNIVVTGNDSGDAQSNGLVILQLKYKVNSSGTVNIKANCSAGTSSGSSNNSVEFKIKDTSEDTTLSSLSVTGGILTPSFSSNITSYTIKLDSINFSLNMTASNEEYQDDIVVTNESGEKLDYKNLTFSDPSGQAKMKLNITVNEKTTYDLLVVYEKKDLDNSLSSLKIDGVSVNLEEGKYDYTVNIKSNVNSVKIEATLKDSTNFKFSDGNGPAIFSTTNIENTYPLIIEPKDSSSGAKGVTYMITLLKEGSASSSSSSRPSNNSQSNATSNPTTGGISTFIMFIILFASLIASIVIYRKNLEGYNNK